MDEKIQSLSSFLDAIQIKIKNITEKGEFLNIWFRGEPSVNFSTSLIPKAYRPEDSDYKDDKFINLYILNNVQDTEPGLMSSFFREAEIFLNKENITNNSWNKYILMQHYGIRTRLLDWSESALIALYFAISDREFSNDDAVIWILSPHRLNEIVLEKFSKGSVNCSSIYFPQNSTKINFVDEENKLNLDELFRMYLKFDFELNNKNYEKEFYPLAIYPYLLDERMRKQKSCFTIFGNIVDGINNIEKKEMFLEKIIINGNSKKNMLKELAIIGITEQDIYPDLNGICKSIDNKYKI